MTITNQTNPVGSSYTSKKSRILAPRGGNLFVQETSFTTLRLTKTGNNPSTYRREIFQHSSAKDEGNVVQIGIVNDSGQIEFNQGIDFKNTEKDTFKKLVQRKGLIKTQTRDAEKQIKNKVNEDKKALNKNEGNETVTDSKDSPKESDPPNKGIARKNYGTLFYPSFIQKSNQDKLKVTILEFSSRFKGGKKDPKKMSQLGQINGKPRRSDFGRGRSGRGKYLAELRKFKKGKGKADLNNSNMSALSLDGRKRMEINKR